MRECHGPESPHLSAEDGISIAGEFPLNPVTSSWDQSEATLFLRNVKIKSNSESALGHTQTNRKDVALNKVHR